MGVGDVPWPGCAHDDAQLMATPFAPIDVILIAWNRPESLQRLVRSLSNAEYDTNARISLTFALDFAGNSSVDARSMPSRTRSLRGRMAWCACSVGENVPAYATMCLARGVPAATTIRQLYSSRTILRSRRSGGIGCKHAFGNTRPHRAFSASRSSRPTR